MRTLMSASSSLRRALQRGSNPRSWLRPGDRLLRCYAARNDGKGTLLVITILCLSCNMLQNVKKSNASDEASLKTNLDISQTGTSSFTRVSDSFVLEKDSANKVYTIRLWPKGKFNFSVAKGFEGEAEKVEVNAWLKEGNYELAQRRATEKLDSNWKNTVVQKQEQKQLKKNGTVEKSVSWKWIIGTAGLAIIILIGIYIKNKIKLWQQ